MKKFYSNNVKCYKYTEIINRSNILLKGSDSENILQSLSTNNMNNFVSNKNISSQSNLLLNTKGRILTDMIVSKNIRYINNKPTFIDNEYILNVNKNKISEILQHLKIHSFKRKIQFEDVSKYFKTSQIYNNLYDYFEDGTEGAKEENFYSNIEGLDENDIIDNLFYDPRNKNLGMMCIHNKDNKIEDILEGIEYEDNLIFELKRKIFNIFEGDEIYNQLPLPLNYDLKDIIKFNKGCYVGQELNARVNFTGLIRKRAYFYVVLKEKIDLKNFFFNFEIIQLYNNNIKDFDLKIGTKFKSIYEKANTGICLFDYVNEDEYVFENNGFYYYIIATTELKDKISLYKEKKSN